MVFFVVNYHDFHFHSSLDKLLDNDVAKARITVDEANEAKKRLTLGTNLSEFAKTEFVIEVWFRSSFFYSMNVSVKAIEEIDQYTSIYINIHHLTSRLRLKIQI